MATRTCIYLSQRDHDDSPPGTRAEVVYTTFILPVMEQFPDFQINLRGHVFETGEISGQLVAEIAEADLVIADLTELSTSGYFELGVRHAAGLPTVLISDLDYVTPVSAREFDLVRYPFFESPATAGDENTMEDLKATIRKALANETASSDARRAPMKRTPKERRHELAERIEETAEVIRLLRSNTAGDAIAELLAIAEELKSAEDTETPSALKEAVAKTLKVLLRIMDQLGTVRGSRIAISGAIALIVGGAGWPAVTALGLGLAFWEGKDAFLRAMEKLGRIRT